MKPILFNTKERKQIAIYSCMLLFCMNINAQIIPTDSVAGKTHTLDEVVIIGNHDRENNLLSPYMGNVSMSSQQIRNITTLFGEADVLKTIQMQPGVSTGIEGFTGLYVRGGENDGNLYMLHGLPLYHVSHIGGLFSSFNVASIDQVNFYKSGFPAGYGGRTSSITDIQLKESNYKKYQGQATLGLLSGNIFITGPIKKDHLAFSIGLRRSWLDLLTIPTLAIINQKKKKDGKKEIGRYAFSDLNLKLDYKWDERRKGYTHFYRGNDYLKIGEGNFNSDKESVYNEENTTGMKWGSWGISTGIELLSSNDATKYIINTYYTHYNSSFKQEQEEEYTEDEIPVDEYIRKKNTNGIEDAGLNLSMEHTFGERYNLKAGAGYILHSYLPEKLTIESNKDNHLKQTLIPGNKVKAHETAVYIENYFTPSKRWQANIGVRGIYYHSSGKGRYALEPRVNVRYLPRSNFSIKVSYSRMTQFVQQICNSYISLPTDLWQPVTGNRKPLSSDQISIGFYGNLPYDFYFSIEGYYKWMNHLLDYKEGVGAFVSDRDWNDKLTTGKGWAYGLDISLRKDIGRLIGSISYSLLWNDRRFPTLNGGRIFPSKYDNRHKLNLTCNYRWSKRVELNAGWSYMTGNRLTLALNNYHGTEGSGFPEDMAPSGIPQVPWGLNYFSTRNNVRLPAYHRLDISINLYRPLSHGRQGIWNISLYNAYSRMNPITINKKGLEDIYGEKKWDNRFQTLSIFPIIPSVSYTYKF